MMIPIGPYCIQRLQNIHLDIYCEYFEHKPVSSKVKSQTNLVNEPKSTQTLNVNISEQVHMTCYIDLIFSLTFFDNLKSAKLSCSFMQSLLLRLVGIGIKFVLCS